MLAPWKSIESRQNPSFKQWRKQLLSPGDPEVPWVAVEGWKAISDLAASKPIQLLLFSNPEDGRLAPLVSAASQSFLLPEHLLRELSSVETPQGVIAFFQKPSWTWSDMPSRAVLINDLQDPGNLGTLLRSARATEFGLSSSPGAVSCYNPKVVRASAAALFATPFLERVAADEFKSRGYRIAASTPRQGKTLFEADLKPPIAILVGNEGSGLPVEVVRLADIKFHIPMSAGSESLNASVAGSLSMYEVFRRWPV